MDDIQRLRTVIESASRREGWRFYLRLLIVILIPAMLSGCLRSGLIFTNVVQPLTRDFNQTPVGSKVVVLGSEKIVEPISGYDLSAEWQKARLKKMVEKEGMTQIHYIERRRYSIFGIYFKNALLVYGD